MISKHKQRRERRTKYREMLRAELADEATFKRRLNRVLNEDGRDFAPDGQVIKGDFFGAIEEWKKTDPQSARACLSLIEAVVHPQSARSCLSLIERTVH